MNSLDTDLDEPDLLTEGRISLLIDLDELVLFKADWLPLGSDFDELDRFMLGCSSSEVNLLVDWSTELRQEGRPSERERWTEALRAIDLRRSNLLFSLRESELLLRYFLRWSLCERGSLLWYLP